mgnify:FL=1
MQSKTVLCHFVQMDKYEVPEEVCAEGQRAIEKYIFERVTPLKPTESETRDWEIVEIQN